jgi:hypothetical protein
MSQTLERARRKHRGEVNTSDEDASDEREFLQEEGDGGGEEGIGAQCKKKEKNKKKTQQQRKKTVNSSVTATVSTLPSQPRMGGSPHHDAVGMGGDVNMPPEDDIDIDDVDWPRTPGPFSEELTRLCQDLGREFSDKAKALGREHGKSLRSILSKAGLLVSLSRKTSRYNKYKHWYKKDKPFEGGAYWLFSCT